jgi:hypothetical protein
VLKLVLTLDVLQRCLWWEVFCKCWLNITRGYDANIHQETEKKSVSLPESEETISTMLKELYNVYNPTTGSIFTNFALRQEMEKEFVMNSLLALFIACDKVRVYLMNP